jgi:hypothetical protein
LLLDMIPYGPKTQVLAFFGHFRKCAEAPNGDRSDLANFGIRTWAVRSELCPVNPCTGWQTRAQP